MILPIIKHPNEILNTKCTEVRKITKDLVQFGKDLIETLENEKGLGLSAPQVGRTIKVLAMYKGKKLLLMYNPSIASRSPIRRIGNEGCLSYTKGEEYAVKRHLSVKVKYLDVNSKQRFIDLTGLDAVVFQHEYSHLLGLTMSDEGVKVEQA